MVRLLLLAVTLLSAAAPLFAAEPLAAELAPLHGLSGDIDRDTAQLMQRLGGSVAPWMWGLAALLWAALVVLAGKLIERGVARLFPDSHPTWLGRSFRVFCYIICALVALYFLLHGFGAAILAGPLLMVEKKLVLLAFAVGIADLALLLVNMVIDRYLEGKDSAGQPIERSPRVLTLLPLLRNIVMIALGLLLTLIVLGEFGVNIAPLLAGAGVIGVAIGFGAQKLVQDVITGAFMLFENTLAVGDAVKIGEHAGVVEGLSIRTLRLRDAYGQLHTMPFSAVSTVINLSRDFGYHPFEINLSYQSDIDRALAEIGAVGAALQSDPTTAADILAPLEVFGVERLTETAVVLSGRIKTPPNRQANIARAFNYRIKNSFAAADLQFAVPARLVTLQGAAQTGGGAASSDSAA